MNKPLVSIVLPCFNAERYIEEAIRSLLHQTYQNIEIIIINDGSVDSSEKVIKSFDDKRIKYYYQSNRGQCAASNFGFSKSIGKYIKFYDADDVLDPEVIRGQVELLENGEPEDISFIEWRRFYDDRLPTSIDLNHPHTIHRDCTPLEYLTFTGKTPMVQCGLWLIPRQLINKSGLWDERLSLINDTEFFSRLLPYAKLLRFSDKGITHYRSIFKGNSLSGDMSRKGIRSALLSIDLMAKWLLKVENSERIKKIIVNSYVMILEWSYPRHKMFSNIIERRLSNYPASYIQHTKSGKMYNLVMTVCGWKVATRLSKFYKMAKLRQPRQFRP